MKKIIAIAFVLMLSLSFLAIGAAAGSGDENYHGENADQPGTGSVGNAAQNPQQGLHASDRTRHKDD